MLTSFRVGVVVVMLLLLITVALQAQINLNTASQGFSQSALQEAKENLKSLNKHNVDKVYLFFSLFHLRGKSMMVKADEGITLAGSLGSVVERVLSEEEVEVNIHEFEALHQMVHTRAQAFHSRLTNKKHVVVINLSMGIQLNGYDLSPRLSSYYHFSTIAGDSVSTWMKEMIQKFIDAPPGNLDFNDVTFKKNDEFLRDLIDHISLRMIPAIVNYDDQGKKNLDDNTRDKCEIFPSFRTQPVSGIPWKCIPSTGVYTSVKVDATLFNGSRTIQFRLSNPTDFQLKSTTPDSNSLLWIKCSNKNKETSVIPTVNGIDLEIQQINVIAYEKIVKEVAIVLIEEENDDVQVVPYETANLLPTDPVVRSGPNHFLDTWPGMGDDQVVVDPATGDSVIVAGPNGICETLASDMNITPIDIDRAELERQLNLFYNPVMVEWKVDKTPYKKAINYDLNKNGILDIDMYQYSPAKGWVLIPSPEEALINAKGPVNATMPHHLYLVDRIEESSNMMVLGRTTGNLKSALIFTREIERFIDAPFQADQMITTCAHELGHAAFQLLHPVAESKDTRNLMGPASVTLDECHLRKFQWDVMHGLATP